MRSKKIHSKKIEEKMSLKGNQTLLGFVKIQKSNSDQQKIKEPKIHVPRHIKIPNSSGDTAELYPQNPVILYPKNPEFRDYQFQISMECIKYNTLVCLPTGLGKTHVASILIMNFTIWFPNNKIFFLAPTRPLVRQQRQSLKWFYEKIGVENVFEMNGQLTGEKRKKFYEQKKVFFATPQTFTNDLKEGRINNQEIKLIIFDQAHRAVGNSAYAESIRFLNKNVKSAPRIIGLSATPGNEKQKIQQVIFNLNIAKMIYKDEEEPDVKKYFFNRSVIPIIIDPPSIIQETLTILDHMVTPYLRFLISLKMADPWVIKSKINSGLFFVVYQTFNQRKSSLDQSNSQFAFSSLRVLKFLIDSKTDLLSHGYETFKSKFFRQIQNIVLQENEQKNEGNEKSGEQSKLSKNSKNSHSAKVQNQNLPKKFKQKTIQSQDYKRIKQLFNPKSNVFNHPKLQKLRQILDEFFKKSFTRLPSGRLVEADKEVKVSNSKCIVFTHFRSTAFQIKTYLSNSQIIRSQMFHGQSKTQIYEDHYNEMGEYENSKQSTLVLNQKQQISIIDKFKKGDINTLIATSIGEEGLDIGEVDCIVCYDGGNKSPIRSIQRFGRTGRKRDGFVYVLLMKGTQESDYKKGQQKIKAMKKMLKHGEFKYYGFNVSLLEEQSEVQVVLYDNQIVQPPGTEKKQRRGRKKKQKQKEENESSQECSSLKEELQEISKDQGFQNQENEKYKMKDSFSISNSEYLQKLFQKDFQETCYISENAQAQFSNNNSNTLFFSQNLKNSKKQQNQSQVKQQQKQKSSKKGRIKYQQKEIKQNKPVLDSKVNNNEGNKKTKSRSKRTKKSQKSKCKDTKRKSTLKKRDPKNSQKIQLPQQQNVNQLQTQKTEQIKQQFGKVNVDSKQNESQGAQQSQKKGIEESHQQLRKSHIEYSSKLMDMFESQRINNATDQNKQQTTKKQVQIQVQHDVKNKLGLMLQEFFENEESLQNKKCLSTAGENNINNKGEQLQMENLQQKMNSVSEVKIVQMNTIVKQQLLNDLFDSDEDEDQHSSLNSSEILNQIIANNQSKTYSID